MTLRTIESQAVLGPAAKRLWATFACPGCGKDVSVDRKVHVVAEDGAVSPSMVCPHIPCSFHEFIRLTRWSP